MHELPIHSYTGPAGRRQGRTFTNFDAVHRWLQQQRFHVEVSSNLLSAKLHHDTTDSTQ